MRQQGCSQQKRATMVQTALLRLMLHTKKKRMRRWWSWLLEHNHDAFPGGLPLQPVAEIVNALRSCDPQFCRHPITA